MPLYTEQGSVYNIKVQDYPDESGTFLYEDTVRITFQHIRRFSEGPLKHRTDGPAVIIWHKKTRGYTQLFYIYGEYITKERYIEILNAPFEKLPLYLNVPLLGEIAKDRLKNESSLFLLEDKHLYLTDTINKYGKVPTPKQVLIKNLITTINTLTAKQIREIVKDMKPFKVLK